MSYELERVNDKVKYSGSNSDGLHYLLHSKKIKQLASISLQYMHLSPEQASLVKEGLLKSPRLVKVDAPSSLFSAEEQHEINEWIKRNQRRKTKYHSYFALWGALLGISGAFATSLSLAMGVLVVIAAAIMGKILPFLRQTALWIAARNYNTVGKISLVTNNTVKEAMLAGVNSHYWKGYLQSFVNYKAYTNYGAYAAGYYAKMNGYKAEADEIKKFKPL